MSIPRSVAFATYDLAPSLTPDDRLAAAALEKRGITVRPAIWSDAGVDWGQFDVIVLRSTWDYHRRAEEFRHWLDRLEASGVPVWNPVPLLRWNLDKRYLRDLSSRGVPTVPTIWLDRGEAPHVDELLEEHGWNEAVLKPVVAATAYRTVRLELAQGAEQRSKLRTLAHEVVEKGEAMLQPFLRQVRDEGEWSLIFIAGEFSHAVLKRPAEGDFRVQLEFGGSAVAAPAPANALAGARAVLDRVSGPWLYARVDGVRTTDGFLLMELEMLEPLLFLALDHSAAVRFADAIGGGLTAAGRPLATRDQP